MKTLAVVLMHVWERAAWSTFPDSYWSQPGFQTCSKALPLPENQMETHTIKGGFDLCQQTVKKECHFKTCFVEGDIFLGLFKTLSFCTRCQPLCAFLERLLQIEVCICFSLRCAGVYCHWARMACTGILAFFFYLHGETLPFKNHTSKWYA